MNNKNFINIALLLIMMMSISLVAYSLVKETNFSNDQWVAKVDGVSISKAKYLLQLEGLRIDKSNPLKEEDRLYVLERMIEEELLIRRAVDLGLLKNNTIVRGTIIQQVINSIISDNALIEITEAELKDFFIKNKAFFTTTDRLRVRQLFFKGDLKESLVRANKAFLDLKSGVLFNAVLLDSDETTLKIPDTLLTLAKVREYLGPSIMQLATSMLPGEFTLPKKASNGYRIIYLVDREDAPMPTFESSVNQIRAEFMKRRDDTSLRSYLNNLKKWYDIERKGVPVQ